MRRRTQMIKLKISTTLIPPQAKLLPVVKALFNV